MKVGVYDEGVVCISEAGCAVGGGGSNVGYGEGCLDEGVLYVDVVGP